VRAFAVVAGNENFSCGDDGVNFAGGVFLWADSVVGAPNFVINKTFGVFVVVDCHNAVFDDDAFARESDDTFDDVLVGDVVRSFASC